jgi:RimJ/RimL family protein N-acetyltransferase
VAARRPLATTLRGRYVELEPTALADATPLYAALSDAEVWRWIPSLLPGGPDEMRDVLVAALAARDAGARWPWTIRLVGGVPVGMTSFLDIRPADESIEIGWTLVGRPWWRSAVNTEAKLLLLSHAFDELGYGRVALKTDLANERSQAAIERLGAVREGVLRRHMARPDGTWRDTVYYSILRDEWPAVSDRLRRALARP